MKDFDWEYYINKYDDLKNKGIDNEKKALKHYEKFGIFENRIINKKFELNVLNNINNDDNEIYDTFINEINNNLNEYEDKKYNNDENLSNKLNEDKINNNENLNKKYSFNYNEYDLNNKIDNLNMNINRLIKIISNLDNKLNNKDIISDKE